MFTKFGIYMPATFTTTSVTGWTYLGCYTVYSRANTPASSTNIYFDRAMAMSKCLAYCKTKGSLIAESNMKRNATVGHLLFVRQFHGPVGYECDIPCGGLSSLKEVANNIGNSVMYCVVV
jgi:hypothetical protein